MPLKIVHTNIAGPFYIVSLGGNRYYVIFIDDFSRKWSEEERKVVGLSSNDNDDNSNIEDGKKDDPTPPQSPNKPTLTSTPSTSGSRSSREHPKKCIVWIIFMNQQVRHKHLLIIPYFV